MEDGRPAGRKNETRVQRDGSLIQWLEKPLCPTNTRFGKPSKKHLEVRSLAAFLHVSMRNATKIRVPPKTAPLPAGFQSLLHYYFITFSKYQRRVLPESVRQILIDTCLAGNGRMSPWFAHWIAISGTASRAAKMPTIFQRVKRSWR